MDVMKQKLDWAEEFGATHVVDASKDDPVAEVQQISGTRRRRLRLRGGGHPEDGRAGLPRTHRGGMAVVVGVCPAGTRLGHRPARCSSSSASLTGTSFGGGHQRTDVPMLIDLFMAGQYKLRELISRRFPLADLNHAYDLCSRAR